MRKTYNFVLFFIFFILIIAVGYRLYYSLYLYPIDLVYLWVDGSDEKWMEKKKYWAEKLNVTNNYSVGQERFKDREELLHSLRSVELYMPWIRKIYIVTDSQIPKWLNVNHPKIKIVDHKDIFHKEALPVFNSIAIETRLPYIKGLSEHFIYANDDVFVNKPLSADFFFDKRGNPIIYTDERLTRYNKIYYEKYADDLWKSITDTPFNLIKSKTEKDISILYKISFGFTHTLFSYKKSDFIKVLELFKEEFKKTEYSKFRSKEDVSKEIVDMWNILHGKATILDAQRVSSKFNCKTSGIFLMLDLEPMVTENPCLFCLNDAKDVPSELHTNYLRKRFPNKSSFEK